MGHIQTLHGAISSKMITIQVELLSTQLATSWQWGQVPHQW
jgi:hypothetical protein